MKRIVLGAAALVLGSLVIGTVPADAQAARNYDCTKAGNANKAACKGKVLAAPAPQSVPANTATARPAAAAPTRNYDCSKAGNASKAACKGTAPVPTAAPPRAAPAPRAAPVARTASGDKPTNPGGPNGATAQCRDSTFSKSTHHSGTCAGHKGVAHWY